jgi:hypothetical protein
LQVLHLSISGGGQYGPTLHQWTISMKRLVF